MHRNKYCICFLHVSLATFNDSVTNIGERGKANWLVEGLKAEDSLTVTMPLCVASDCTTSLANPP